MNGGLKARAGGGRRAAVVATCVLALAVLFAPAPSGAQEASSPATARGAQGPAEAEESYTGLPNFHRVSANLYRGGQPGRGGLSKLAELGVKTVLNLRDDDGRAVEE